MFGSIAHRYDLTNSVLSMGIHRFWRRVLVQQLPTSKDALVLDLCSGTGDLVPLLERRFGTTFAGDFCFPMMSSGRAKFRSQRFSIPRFVQSDALRLPFADASLDIVSVAFGVRNLENLDKGLQEMRRVLKPGGHLLVLEFGQPRGYFFAPLFRFYSAFIMPLIGGLLTGNLRAYTYLPKTSREFPCAEAFSAILQKAGYEDARYRSLTGGIAYAYCARRPK
ncbi:MAG: ubiquinone/menaquinone biosynthesis methyltransferase [Deltaproteobacteria bacterium]|nr:ubiquinone/menaquinone biosynthesis methyltransferase [Deltaproteobacteria bacterium]